MTNWRVLVVDDELDIATTTSELLQTTLREKYGEGTVVEAEPSFTKALLRVANCRFDLIVLDVRNQSATVPGESDKDEGLRTFESVRALQFIPVVFYTALPHLAEPLPKPPFVAVVSKTSEKSESELRTAVVAALDSTLSVVSRALQDHVRAVTKDFMSDFIEARWAELQAPERKSDIAHLLIRRLALSLADEGRTLEAKLGGAPAAVKEGTVHPMRQYVIPPVGDYVSGDLLTESSGTDGTGRATPDRWFVLVTPSCDLVPDRLKADRVLLAECTMLDTEPEFARWANTDPPSKTASEPLTRLLANNGVKRQEDRFHYLPGVWDIPDLLVDWQRLQTMAYADLAKLKRRATLDSPYAEALVGKMGRYLCRIGVPDLDVDAQLARFREKLAQTPAGTAEAGGTEACGPTSPPPSTA